MAKRKPQEASKPGSPAWMATYSDMVTLLFAFFVLMFAMSNTDPEKFSAMAAALSSRSTSIIPSIGGGGAHLMMGSGILEMPKISTSDTSSTSDDGEQDGEQGGYGDNQALEDLRSLASDFETYFAENNMSSMVSAEFDGKAINIVFKDGVLFDSGSADIKSSAMQTLDFIANELLKQIDNEMEIVGHTDSDPISTDRFQDNWFLSAARAINVGKFFIDVKGFSRERISVVGKGEFQPIAPNDTAENKAKNRRVEIKVQSTLGNDVSSNE